jgi:iron complex transport system permease protein
MSGYQTAASAAVPALVPKSFGVLLVLMLTALLAASAVGLSVGSTGWQWPWGDVTMSSGMVDIVWRIRAPRTLGAGLVGGLLGLAGAVAQGLFRNPLAEPYLLGSASGAALAIALMLALGAPGLLAASAWWHVGFTGVAFVGAVVGVSLTLLLARGAVHTMRLLLAGVVVGVVLGAITQLLMVWSGEVWRVMQAFMLGSTALLGWQACGVMAAVFGLALPVGLMLARVLDALSLGDDTAKTLGIPLGWTRMALVGVMALVTAAAVAQAGLVAFVGLVAPHLVRPWAGAGHVRVLFFSSAMGALLLMVADVLARCLLAPQELPVGVITAVLGGVYLLLVLHRKAI